MSVSLSITDLCDIDGFEDKPSPDKVYGLQHRYGTYKRTEIKPPKLNELEDVDGFAEGVENKMYGLKFTGNKYVQEEIKFSPLNSIVDNYMGDPYIRMSIFKDGDGNWFAMPQIPWSLDLNPKFEYNVDKYRDSPTKYVFNMGKIKGFFQLKNVKMQIYWSRCVFEKLPSSASDSQKKKFEIITFNPYNEEDISGTVFTDLIYHGSFYHYSLYIEVALGQPQDTFIKILRGVEIKWKESNTCRICINNLEGIDISIIDGNMRENDEVQIRLGSEIYFRQLFVHDNLAFIKYKYINWHIPMKYLKAAG